MDNSNVVQERNGEKLKFISVKDAAKIMGKSDQFVRMGLRSNILPFGVAVKMSTQWAYYISPKLFYEYVGEDTLQQD